METTDLVSEKKPHSRPLVGQFALKKITESENRTCGFANLGLGENKMNKELAKSFDSIR